MRPIFTVSVFINPERQLVLKATRHGLDEIEIWAAAGYLAQTLGVAVGSMITKQRPQALADADGK
jgi:hypothetical protein